MTSVFVVSLFLCSDCHFILDCCIWAAATQNQEEKCRRNLQRGTTPQTHVVQGCRDAASFKKRTVCLIDVLFHSRLIRVEEWSLLTRHSKEQSRWATLTSPQTSADARWIRYSHVKASVRWKLIPPVLSLECHTSLERFVYDPLLICHCKSIFIVFINLFIQLTHWLIACRKLHTS